MQPRFKRLSIEELQVLEQQFVQFLSAQSITADDWQSIKRENLGRADELIVMFSDMVYGSVMSDAQFLENRTENRLYAYQCLADRFVVVVFEVDDTSIDLRNTEITISDKIPTSRVYNSESAYTKSKEDEVFELMQTGCEITDGSMFKLLCTML